MSKNEGDVLDPIIDTGQIWRTPVDEPNRVRNDRHQSDLHEQQIVDVDIVKPGSYNDDWDIS